MQGLNTEEIFICMNVNIKQLSVKNKNLSPLKFYNVIIMNPQFIIVNDLTPLQDASAASIHPDGVMTSPLGAAFEPDFTLKKVLKFFNCKKWYCANVNVAGCIGYM